MAKHALKNAGGVPFLVLKGIFVVKAGHQPDGDTIHFAATAKYTPGSVDTNVPVSPDGSKSKAIRLQSIDAPEKAQPLGAKSRDALLTMLGFKPSSLGLSDTDFTVGGPTQTRVGWLATHGMDGNDRPLGYLFTASPGFKHGAIVTAADVLGAIKASANYRQASAGWVFPAFYENTDETHAAVFQKAAAKARDGKKGVWSKDLTTVGFVPTATALGKNGTLVYPKFFRRVEKWKAAKPNAQAFINWLKTQADGKKPVQGAKPTPVPLWTLFERVSSQKVAVPYDVTRLWFSE
jgi:endonuclease YncB( thermonuclease family)